MIVAKRLNSKPLVRHFGVAVEQPPQKSPELPKVKNSLLNQHIKYVPRKRVRFDLSTPEGRMALVFKGKDNAYNSVSKFSMFASLAAMFLRLLAGPSENLILSEAVLSFPLYFSIRKHNAQQ